MDKTQSLAREIERADGESRGVPADREQGLSVQQAIPLRIRSPTLGDSVELALVAFVRSHAAVTWVRGGDLHLRPGIEQCSYEGCGDYWPSVSPLVEIGGTDEPHRSPASAAEPRERRSDIGKIGPRWPERACDGELVHSLPRSREWRKAVRGGEADEAEPRVPARLRSTCKHGLHVSELPGHLVCGRADQFLEPVHGIPHGRGGLRRTTGGIVDGRGHLDVASIAGSREVRRAHDKADDLTCCLRRVWRNEPHEHHLRMQLRVAPFGQRDEIDAWRPAQPRLVTARMEEYRHLGISERVLEFQSKVPPARRRQPQAESDRKQILFDEVRLQLVGRGDHAGEPVALRRLPALDESVRRHDAGSHTPASRSMCVNCSIR